MDAGAVMFGEQDMVPVTSPEFIVGVIAVLVAGFVFLRFLPPLALFLASVALTAWAASGMFDDGEVSVPRLVLTAIFGIGAARDWYKNIRGNSDVHRNEIFGFGKVPTRKDQEHDP